MSVTDQKIAQMRKGINIFHFFGSFLQDLIYSISHDRLF